MKTWIVGKQYLAVNRISLSLLGLGLTLITACNNSTSQNTPVGPPPPEFATAVVSVDFNGDGNPDKVSTLTFVTENQQILTQDVIQYDQATGDILDTYLQTYSYDSNGFLSQIVYAQNGMTLSTNNYTNDDRGNLLVWAPDYEADGVPNRTITREYSQANDITRELYDDNADGINERERQFTYTDPKHYDSRRYDDNGDGFFEYLEQLQFDPDNSIREVHYDIDLDGDGIFDQEYFVTWTDNTDGSATRLLERDLDLDGNIDRTDIRVILRGADMGAFERQDKTLNYIRDLDNDGNPDYQYSATFNAQEQVLTFETDTDGDGFNDRLHERTYTTDNNPLTYQEFDENGVPGYSVTYSYTDWTIGEIDIRAFNFDA